MDLQTMKEEALRMAAETLSNGTRESAAYDSEYVRGALDLVINLEAEAVRHDKKMRMASAWDEVEGLMHQAERMLCFYREMLDGLMENKQVVVDDSMVSTRRMAVNVWLRKKKELIGGEENG